MYFEKDQLRKALVSLAIEKALLEIGEPVYDSVKKPIDLVSTISE